MKKTTRTTTEDVWECETCGSQYNNKDDYGKWCIFHCPKHGEFCNDGLNNCGLYRVTERKRSGTAICCPICGWIAIEDQTDEYDKRKGELPQTEREKKSLKWGQDFILSDSHNFSGSPSYKRLKAWKEKNDVL
ncbi:hypothetical protein ES703_73825 [subsurface metagenome]